MREELEIRLEESCFPVPEWVDFDGKSGSSLSVNRETNISKTVPYPSGHVKLELEGRHFCHIYKIAVPY